MTIQEVHERVKFELNKTTGGYVSSEDIDRTLDRAQLAELNHLLGSDREYQPGNPIPRVSYGVSRKVNTDLLHLRRTFEVVADNYATNKTNGTGPDGIIVLPSSYLYLTALTDSSRRRIEVVNEDQIPEIIDSELIAPSTTNRYAVISGKGGTVNGVTFTNHKIQMFPEEGFAGYVEYLKRPATPVRAYTTSGRTQTYDAASSTDLEWPDHVIERIIVRAVAMIGQHLKEQAVTQYNEQKNQS